MERTISVAKMASDRAKAEQRLKRYPAQEIGDYASYEDLLSSAGRFYNLGEMEFCDMPTMTFEREDVLWRRIE